MASFFCVLFYCPSASSVNDCRGLDGDKTYAKKNMAQNICEARECKSAVNGERRPDVGATYCNTLRKKQIRAPAKAHVKLGEIARATPLKSMTHSSSPVSNWFLGSQSLYLAPPVNSYRGCAFLVRSERGNLHQLRRHRNARKARTGGLCHASAGAGRRRCLAMRNQSRAVSASETKVTHHESRKTKPNSKRKKRTAWPSPFADDFVFRIRFVLHQRELC